MDFTSVETIARTILYEGYMLYPYRTSSLKNSRPCMFGSLHPKAYCLATGDTLPWSMETECLIRGDVRTTLNASIRFLQLGKDRQGIEREIVVGGWRLHEFSNCVQRCNYSFPDLEFDTLQVCVEVFAELMCEAVFKVKVRIVNETPLEPIEGRAGVEPNMLSTHALLGVEGGRFHSLIDAPPELRAAAETCRNRGLWPVLIGDSERCNMMLAAPIILYDFPQVAPESPGNLFDGTEIDELLTLRIATLTDVEKQAMKADPQTRAILARTEQLTDGCIRTLHGTMRSTKDTVLYREPGARVRLRPRGRADIFDLALDGQAATVVSVEQDFEGRVYCTVALDGDPGRDLGMEGKPGHRFFFRADELEPLDGDSR